MRSYVLLAAATGAIATSGMDFSAEFGFTLPFGCDGNLISTILHDVVPFIPEFCPKFKAGASCEELGAHALTGIASIQIGSACDCIPPKVTGTVVAPTVSVPFTSAPGTPTATAVATTSAAASSSEVSSEASSPSSSAVAPTTTPAKGPGAPDVSSSTEAASTVAPQTSVRKCRGSKPTGEVSSSSAAPSSSSAVEPTTAPTTAPATTSEPAKATPTGAVGTTTSAEPSKATPTGAVGTTTKPGKTNPAGPTSTCKAPKIKGGDFSGILGEIIGKPGWTFTSTQGSCGAKVFDSSSTGGLLASFGIGRRTGALLSSLNVSGTLKSIFGASHFLQITGSSANTKQQLCHKVPVCKGHHYKVHVNGGCDKQGSSMGFSVGGNVLGAAGALVSPVKDLTMGASASMDWEFTWNAEGAEIDCCILTNIGQELGSIGLSGWTMGFAGEAGIAV